MRRIALIAFLAVFTAACSTSIRSDVTRFHKLPEPQGETVFITSSDAAKSGGIEFSQYAGLLVPQLGSLGYRVVTDPNADLVVEIDYDVTQSERRYYTSGGYPFYHYPFYSPFHFGFRHHGFGHGGFGHHGFGYSGFGYAYYPQQPYIRTIYTSRLSMKIRRVDGELLFEGNALSTAYRDRLPEVMPYLVSAMFTNFPGQSGSTEVVRIERYDSGQS
jgi:hypothetical protein